MISRETEPQSLRPPGVQPCPFRDTAVYRPGDNICDRCPKCDDGEPLRREGVPPPRGLFTPTTRRTSLGQRILARMKRFTERLR